MYRFILLCLTERTSFVRSALFMFEAKISLFSETYLHPHIKHNIIIIVFLLK